MRQEGQGEGQRPLRASWPGLARPSTIPSKHDVFAVVDARPKAGHDAYSVTCRVIAAESLAAQRRTILPPTNSNHSIAMIS
jgi:hypothetical protein